MSSQDPAKLILRDLINATEGFEAPAQEIHQSDKSLYRMLSKSDNPAMSNICEVFAAIKSALKAHADCAGLSRFWQRKIVGVQIHRL